MWPSSDRRFEPPEKAALPVVEGSSESDRELEVELRGRHWIPIAAYIAAIFAATSILHVRLPEPKAGTTDPREFSELRARRLVDIMSGYGPKPAGSYACEVQTKKFILGELEVIRTAATVKMEITLQNPSGCFDIPRFDTDGFTVCYKNVSNVAVRLTYDEKTFNDPLRVAVLLNCHFDSWPTSSGGSDDLVSCALMLELIRLLSRDKAALVDHDVIFLFNGENIHATLLHLLQSPYLDNPAEYGDQKYVFFDVLGVFVVVYAESIGNAINAALVLTAFLKVANHVRRNCKLAAYASAIENVHQSMVAVILAFLTAKGVSSGYIFALMLIPMAKGVGPGKKEWSMVTVHLVLYTPTYVMCVYLTSMFLSIFIPIMGRTGSNPELLVAIFTNFAIYTIVLSMLPLVVITKNQRQREDSTISNFLRMIGGILVTTSAMLAMIHLLFKYPYLHTDDYPMARRIQIFHANREFFNKDEGRLLKDSGIYVIAQDYRGAEDIPFVDGDYSQLKCIYDSPYCEIPLYFPTRSRIQDRHIRFRSLEDINLPETKVNLLQKTEYLNQLVYDFNIKVPQSGYQVANCSLSAPRKENDDRPLFLFLTCNGDRCGEWTFRLTLASSSGRNTDEDSQLLLGVASHYLHGNYMQSNAIRRLLAEIGNKRRNDTAWAITASAWNVDLRYKYF
ncbi:unnamed protein product [Nippostrongylus brasiliensis]|uniref:Uncharacterized zinc metalloprotease (inferred by orthology to a C. elegans protein) n=1 Tax=Nippostrongylus brasiliensis TaxID=27835 RepID=A0A0N4YL34_NIPBR|nr:unnamed protein product [Nippostrongylus brasiliensis]